MNQQEWLEWRRKGIGASDAPVIMGVSPWKTPYQLWEEKVYGIDSTVDTPAMERGRALEEPARERAAAELGASFAPSYMESPKYPWMRASFDGYDHDKKIAVEIKAPGAADHKTAKEGKVPSKYFPQLQHQLAVAELPLMYYYSYDGSNGVMVEVKRDEKYLEHLYSAEAEFWQQVLKKEAPEKCAQDIHDLEADKDWRLLSDLWKMTSAELKDAERREKELRQKLIAKANGKSSFGNGVKLLRVEAKGAIDYSLMIEAYLSNLKSEHPEIAFPDMPYEAYRKDNILKYTLRIT